MGGGSFTNLRRAIDGEFRTLFNLRRYWRRILGGYLVWSVIVTFGGQQKPLFSHKLPDGSWLLVDQVSFGTHHFYYAPHVTHYHLPPFRLTYRPPGKFEGSILQEPGAYFWLRLVPPRFHNWPTVRLHTQVTVDGREQQWFRHSYEGGYRNLSRLVNGDLHVREAAGADVSTRRLRLVVRAKALIDRGSETYDQIWDQWIEFEVERPPEDQQPDQWGTTYSTKPLGKKVLKTEYQVE